MKYIPGALGALLIVVGVALLWGGAWALVVAGGLLLALDSRTA